MLSIFKRKTVDRPDLSGLVTDMHSHLVPGIDDGSPDVDTSVGLVNGLLDLGYQKLITTPHVLWDIYKNNASTIEPAYQQLQQALSPQQANAPISYAAEYFLDDHVDDLIEDGIPLLTLKDNWLLVEISFVSPPLNLKEKLFSLEIAGYKPILAHPERYVYFSRDKSQYDDLKEAGCRFQVNLLSLTGYYGKAPQELAQYLLKKKFIDLLGTDLHHMRHLQALQVNPQLTDIVKQLEDSGNMLNPAL